VASEVQSGTTSWSDALAGAGLTRAGSYRRSVAAGLERIWENVFDWEHLPWLHAASFASIELVERGAWGWRARVVPRGRARTQLLEVRVDRARGRYVSATLEGPGTATEIWTRLVAQAPERTDVDVAFWIPEQDPARVASLGRGLARVYAQLWDEDEAMMVRRTRELAARRTPPCTALELRLGPLAALRPRLPLRVELGGQTFRVLEAKGELFAHATRCPHRLGPLEDVPLDEDCAIRCPWHGYRFDLRTGASLDGRKLRLAGPACVDVDSGGEVVLRVGSASERSG
jgi:nitrite reductase/ring-hydroxylating ferredoxin subunit